jgi:ribosomal protein L17
VAALHAKRPGGYVRITKLPIKRQDDASMARIDIIAEDVTK